MAAEEPIQNVLDERGKRYGEFDEHARITQAIKAAMVSGRSWIACDNAQREALEMVAHKIGRIVNGDPDYLDSWVDIAGYTQLVINNMQREKAPVYVPPHVEATWSYQPKNNAAYERICRPYAAHAKTVGTQHKILYSSDSFYVALDMYDQMYFDNCGELPLDLQEAYAQAVARRKENNSKPEDRL